MKSIIENLMTEAVALKAKIEGAIKTLEDAEAREEDSNLDTCIASLYDAATYADELAQDLRDSIEALDD
jgi:tRNA A37 threonylcarbamoyladenosine synthetase subunit TsaC/SUA5/YrdC